MQQTLGFHTCLKNVFRSTLHEYFKGYSFYYQILQTQKIIIKQPAAARQIHHSQLGKASTKQNNLLIMLQMILLVIKNVKVLVISSTLQ